MPLLWIVRPAEITLRRQFWVVAHRWAGLTITLFLVIVGFTGALLPWNEELTLLGRPSLSHAAPPRPGAAVLDGITLAERVEKATGAKVGFLNLDIARDHVVSLSVRGVGATPLAYDTVWADPYSGEIRLKFRQGALLDGPQTIISFLYRLHYELALGPVGAYALGVAALIWTLDCFVGFYLTLPIRRKPLPGARPPGSPGWWTRWKPAWLVRWTAGSYRLTFDLHRAGGLWVWPVLLVFAWSSVGLNLPQVHRPVMRAFGSRDADLPKAPVPLPVPPIGLREARDRGEALLRHVGAGQGFAVQEPSFISYYPAEALYRYAARSTADVVDRGGRTTVYFSGVDGRMVRYEPPVSANGTDAFSQWLNMLHFAEVFGLPYRAFVSAVGVLVVVLSVTGVLIWTKKRSARLLKARREVPAPGRHHPRVTVPAE